MRNRLILALAALSLLAGCLAGCASTPSAPSEFAERAGRFLDTAVPILDELAAAETDPDRLQDFATARAALEGLRSVATAGASLDTLRDMAPALREVLLARGRSADDAARTVSIYLLTLAALEAALA